MLYRGLPARDKRAFRFIELPPEEGGRLAEAGFVIAWPYGERWEHSCVTYAEPQHTDKESQ